MKELVKKYSYTDLSDEAKKNVASLRRIDAKLKTNFNLQFLLEVDKDVWLDINGTIYWYTFDTLEQWTYYYAKYSRNRGKLLSMIKPFCNGKVEKAYSYELI